MFSLLAAVAVLTQSGAPTPNIGPQGPLLVAEEVFTGTVLSVEDGDTAVIKGPAEETTVHLAALDAPETSQSGGRQAKAFLQSLIGGKTVTVRLTNVAERLARIELGGKDVTETMIRAGMGWHCPRYSEDRELTRAEAEARGAKRGLWTVSQPTPPWLYRGAGACWQERSKPRVSSQLHERPDFSGTWTAIGPSHRAGQKIRITQDALSLTLQRISDPDQAPSVYKLDGTTSRALVTPHGPVDIVAKTRWNGAALIVEERRWNRPGEEATNLRHVLWMDDRGLLNVEVSSPQPIGQSDATTLVMRRHEVPPPQ